MGHRCGAVGEGWVGLDKEEDAKMERGIPAVWV